MAGSDTIALYLDLANAGPPSAMRQAELEAADDEVLLKKIAFLKEIRADDTRLREASKSRFLKEKKQRADLLSSDVDKGIAWLSRGFLRWATSGAADDFAPFQDLVVMHGSPSKALSTLYFSSEDQERNFIKSSLLGLVASLSADAGFPERYYAQIARTIDEIGAKADAIMLLSSNVSKAINWWKRGYWQFDAALLVNAVAQYCNQRGGERLNMIIPAFDTADNLMAKIYNDGLFTEYHFRNLRSQIKSKYVAQDFIDASRRAPLSPWRVAFFKEYLDEKVVDALRCPHTKNLNLPEDQLATITAGLRKLEMAVGAVG